MCDAEGNGRGGSWGEDGIIIFAPNAVVGLSRVSSAGGTPEDATTLDKEKDETSHRWPQVLPGGKSVLFTVILRVDKGFIEVQSLETGERKTLQQGGVYGRYLPTGHLVYISEATMFAAPFDLGRLEVTGPPAPIVEDVQTSPNFRSAQFDFSQTGTLVYLTGAGETDAESIFWMDAEAKTEPLLPAPRNYLHLSFSPDGKRLAVEIDEGSNMDLWVYELERETLSRLTFDEEADFVPVWTPDGQRVAFSSNRDGGTWNLYWKRADGTGDAERLTESGDLQLPWSWSPGGKVLAFFERSAETRWDLWTLPMEEDEQGALKPGKPTVFLRTPFIEGRPAFSPDGRWIAYNSNESGRFEVYVRPFPGPGGKWQISTTGGEIPTWSKNRRELFYRTLDNRIMVVTYSVEGDSFRAGRPRLWSEGQFTDRGLGRNFDLHPDGKRFAVLKAAEGTEEVALDHLTLVTNWFDEVRRRVASAGQN